MPKEHVLRNYNKMPAPVAAEKTLLVVTKMTGNAYFVTPEVELTLLTTTANSLIAAVAKADGGTPEDTAHKLAILATLRGLLDTQANYVENIAQNNREIILSSGFDPASTSRTPAIVTGSSILGCTNVASTKIGLEVVIDPNAWGYEIQVNTPTNPIWAHWETFTDPHDIVLLNLVPGTLYGIRVRVLGAGNQRSEWSEPVTHMAT
jgi:hypothetical protein